ncbi:MAG: RdgB/HAM1 family non-canonical purine NTP pyrophosphatase [Clostridiales bacterium]|nr:RdgB/HAM1 family non-canonical purine NTP pyrophosphatase [Clostridiales bacterium]
MKTKIVLASGNKKKLKEIREMLPDFDVVPCSELGFTDDVEETGTTFYENALIKAKTVSLALGLPALADDSGICVDSLDGAPGIYSARYAGDGIDEHNNQLLLKNLEGKENRNARFVCCMVYYKPNGEIITATGKTEGYVTHAPEGENGFGYDPIFFSYDLNKCLGVAEPEEKNKISHRYRALKELKDKLV